MGGGRGRRDWHFCYLIFSRFIIEGNKDFEMGGKLGQGVGALKKGGRDWNPLMYYGLYVGSL